MDNISHMLIQLDEYINDKERTIEIMVNMGHDMDDSIKNLEQIKKVKPLLDKKNYLLSEIGEALSILTCYLDEDLSTLVEDYLIIVAKEYLGRIKDEN